MSAEQQAELIRRNEELEKEIYRLKVLVFHYTGKME